MPARSLAAAAPSVQGKSSAAYDAQAMAADIDYWRRRLAGGMETLELPVDRRRPAFRSTASQRLSCALPSRMHGEVCRLASRLRAKPIAVMLGAFALLLQRYSGQRDMRIAVPLRHDGHAVEVPVGPSENTAVIRLSVAPGEGFSSLVEQAERYLAEARAHGRLPFASIVRSIAVPRSMSNTPLCQVMFSELPAIAPGRYGDLKLRAFDDAIGRGQYDLSLNVAPSDHGCTLLLDYSSTLFYMSTVQRMLSHYVALLEQLTHSASSAARPMASLELRHVEGAAAAA